MRIRQWFTHQLRASASFVVARPTASPALACEGVAALEDEVLNVGAHLGVVGKARPTPPSHHRKTRSPPCLHLNIQEHVTNRLIASLVERRCFDSLVGRSNSNLKLSELTKRFKTFEKVQPDDQLASLHGARGWRSRGPGPRGPPWPGPLGPGSRAQRIRGSERALQVAPAQQFTRLSPWL